ncbi:MAG: flagellar hook-length control protein FliK [Betaproteobacteria bacterium]
MQTSSSPLTFLATTVAGGKPTVHPAGPHVHKGMTSGAEARPNNAEPDGADGPEESSNFSRMLRDRAARARHEKAGAQATAHHETAGAQATTERQGDTGAQPPGPASAEQGSASEASTELNALLASLMQGQGSVQVEGGAKPARHMATSTMETQESAAIGGPAHARGRTPRSAALSLDKNAAADGQLSKSGTTLANREVVTAAAAARAGLAGVGAGSGSHPTASETSQLQKSALQRAATSDALSANATGSITALANSGPLNMPTNGLLPGAASTMSAFAASATVDTALAQDVRRPEFVPAFSARIATLVQEGVEHARVHLNPVEMGPVSLQLSLEGQQVRVDMTAEAAVTRQVLEQALPTLAGALREAGFTLSGGGVSQPAAETANLGGQDPRNAGGSSGEPPLQTSGSSTGTAGQQADGRRAPEGERGPNQGSGTITATGGLVTELHLDGEGRPHLPPGRGLVDTFA